MAWTLAMSGSCAFAQQPTKIDVGDAPPKEAEIARPETAGRLVKVFDFEERHTNPGEVPRDWYRAQEDPALSDRPGFPSWNRASLVFTADGGLAAGGEGAVRLPTQGGNTSLILGPGVIPVFRSADYGITAKVRTRGMTRARAGVAVRYIDSRGQRIPESESRTAFVQSENTWTDIRVEAVGRYTDAAFLQIELLVEQPTEGLPKGASIDPRFQVVRHDLSADAWFDDVIVTQLPRVELSTQSPINVLLASQRPQLRWVVRDLAGETLEVRMRVFDADGREVVSEHRRLSSGKTEESWAPKLPGLGWYRAGMVVEGKNGVVGGADLDFVWVPDRLDVSDGATVTSRDRERLGLIIGTLYPELEPTVREVCVGLGVGALTLPAWSVEMTSEQSSARASRLSSILRSLGGMRTTVAFDRLPDALSRASRRPADDVWGEFESPMKEWFAFTSPLLEALGQQAANWQIGSESAGIGFKVDREKRLETAGSVLSALVPAPRIAVPISIDVAWSRPWAGPRAGGSVLVASMPSSMPDFGAGEAVGAWARALGTQSAGVGGESGGSGEGRVGPSRTVPWSLDVILAAPSQAEVGAARQAVSISRTLVEAWAAGAETDSTHPITFAIKEPWGWSGARRPSLTPTPAFAAWRATGDRLVGRHCVGELDLGPGIRALLFSPESRAAATIEGMIAVWVQSPTTAKPRLEAYLGEGPLTIYDHFGNAKRLVAERDEIGGDVTRIDLTDRPLFIEGVNLPLVMMLASIRIEPSLLETNNRQGEHFVVFDNFFSTGVSGRISVLEPGGFLSGKPDRTWRISPRDLRFNAGPDSSGRSPMSIAFSSTQEAGERDFVFKVEVLADRAYGPILVRRPVAIGLSGLSVDLTVTERRNSTGGLDVVIEAAIANTGAKPVTLDLTAFAPDEPRRKSAVAELPPGQQTVRRFVYVDAVERLSDREVMVSVSDADTGAKLNRTIRVP